MLCCVFFYIKEMQEIQYRYYIKISNTLFYEEFATCFGQQSQIRLSTLVIRLIPVLSCTLDLIDGPLRLSFIRVILVHRGSAEMGWKKLEDVSLFFTSTVDCWTGRAPERVLSVCTNPQTISPAFHFSIHKTKLPVLPTSNKCLLWMNSPSRMGPYTTSWHHLNNCPCNKWPCLNDITATLM